MDIPPELKDVQKFLEEFRACRGFGDISINRRYYKNIDFIQKSGITIEEIEEILIKELGPQHYKKGPEQEINQSYPEGVIYHFNFNWENYKIYIKLKIIIRGSQRTSYCMAFHD